ncbi:MAG: ABC transporter ATP-binding protein [bacterium]
MEPLLEVKEIYKTFLRNGKDKFTAIDGVSFKLYPGEILGIVGESGSGKSTVAKAIARLIDIDSGSIQIEGEDITQLKNKELHSVYRKLQMVFQSPVGSFDPRRTLGSGITESLINNGVSNREALEKAQKLLVQCGLPAEFIKRYPHEVSGGQCQRAAIARALAIEPKILICDEATSGLDATVQKQVIELLDSLQKNSNMSYIFICHNLALVQQFCHRVLVMNEGKIVEEGIPDDVIMNPQSDYTKKLVDAVL